LGKDKDSMSEFSERTPSYLEELNPDQYKAVTAGKGPIMVIAGAGSGKTRVVTHRLAYLVDKGITPARILLVTFTQKAAREMLHRAGSIVNKDISKLWGGTFHHIGNLILRRHASLIDYSSSYSILDREDSKDLLQICRGEILGKKVAKEEKKLFPKSSVLINILSFSLNTSTPLEEVVQFNYPHLIDDLPRIEEIYQRYEEKKKEIGGLDFDDLLVKSLDLLKEKKDLRDYYNRYFQYILVDEYQDTNILQAEFIDLLGSQYKNIMVVGDDSQSIYSFRGARFKNILEFPEKYPEAKIFTVEINYRSRPQILKFANCVITSSQHRFKKGMKAVRSPGVNPWVVPTMDVYEQASFIARRIVELYEGDVSLADIAILYRAHFHSMEIQMEFIRKGIPFNIRSGLRFFERAHIKDVLAYLKILNNKKDELSWSRLLKHLPGVGEVTVARIWQKIARVSPPFSMSSRDIKLPKGTESGFREIMSLLKELNSKNMLTNPAEIIRRIVEKGYSHYLEANFPDWRSRLEDLEQFANFASRYSSLQNFVSELSLVGGMRSEDIVAQNGEEEGVILSTVHQAKGLEWKVVFIVWLVEGYFPSYQAETEEEKEEERRLFYVGVTRARDELYLLYPLSQPKSNVPWTINDRSSFLEEVDSQAYEEMSIEQVRGWE